MCFVNQLCNSCGAATRSILHSTASAEGFLQQNIQSKHPKTPRSIEYIVLTHGTISCHPPRPQRQELACFAPCCCGTSLKRLQTPYDQLPPPSATATKACSALCPPIVGPNYLQIGSRFKHSEGWIYHNTAAGSGTSGSHKSCVTALSLGISDQPMSLSQPFHLTTE